MICTGREIVANMPVFHTFDSHLIMDVDLVDFLPKIVPGCSPYRYQGERIFNSLEEN
jgi:hypothetical protein